MYIPADMLKEIICWRPSKPQKASWTIGRQKSHRRHGSKLIAMTKRIEPLILLHSLNSVRVYIKQIGNECWHFRLNSTHSLNHLRKLRHLFTFDRVLIIQHQLWITFDGPHNEQNCSCMLQKRRKLDSFFLLVYVCLFNKD
jgi:hypothetical protein